MTTKSIPAFPVPLNPGQSWDRMAPCDGMTLRDYFAAKAMPLAFDYVRRINTDGYEEDSVDGRSNSFNSTYDFTWNGDSGSERGDIYMVAEYAYQMADAMIAARSQ